MTDTQDESQDRGEIVRQHLGIDGTADDAQGVQHPYTPDMMFNPAACLACGQGLFHQVHDEDAR